MMWQRFMLFSAKVPMVCLIWIILHDIHPHLLHVLHCLHAPPLHDLAGSLDLLLMWLLASSFPPSARLLREGPMLPSFFCPAACPSTYPQNHDPYKLQTLPTNLHNNDYERLIQASFRRSSRHTGRPRTRGWTHFWTLPPFLCSFSQDASWNAGDQEEQSCEWHHQAHRTASHHKPCHGNIFLLTVCPDQIHLHNKDSSINMHIKIARRLLYIYRH